jgi:Uncharacterized protein conserved in bacteria (DUF2252)
MARKPSKGAAPKERAGVLLRTRHLKMAPNAHAYVRGSTAKFYEWLRRLRLEGHVTCRTIVTKSRARYAGYSTLMLAVRITPPHFAISSR